MIKRFIKNTKKTKCKRCGESTICFKDTLKGTNICEDCLEHYKQLSVKCSNCKSTFKRDKEYMTGDSEKDKLLKNRNFCSKECYDNFIKEEEEKDKMNEWLKNYFKTDKLPSRIYVQMEDFKNKKNISYKWTFATLRYVALIKGEEIKEGTIGIVPYVVDECKEHVKKVNEAKRNRNESKLSRATISSEVITIKMIDISEKRNRAMNKKLITESDLKEVILW